MSSTVFDATIINMDNKTVANSIEQLLSTTQLHSVLQNTHLTPQALALTVHNNFATLSAEVGSEVDVMVFDAIIEYLQQNRAEVERAEVFLSSTGTNHIICSPIADEEVIDFSEQVIGFYQLDEDEMEEVKAQLEEDGTQFTDSIDNTTTLIIIGEDTPSDTEVLNAYQARGIKVIDYDMFWDYLDRYSI